MAYVEDLEAPPALHNGKSGSLGEELVVVGVRREIEGRREEGTDRDCFEIGRGEATRELSVCFSVGSSFILLLPLLLPSFLEVGESI